MSKLMLMCGIPGSGKTTAAKQLMGDNIKYISRDEIRFSIIKDGDEYFSKETEVFNEYINQINKALKEDYDVIADATHLNKGSRAKVLNRLTIKPDTIIVTMPCVSLETAIERNNKRTGLAKVPENQIRRMFHQIELPTYEEGIDYFFKYIDGSITVIDLKEELWQ